MRKLALTMTCTTCVFSAFGVFARWLQNMTAFEENGLYIPGSLWGIVLTLLYIAGAAVFFGFTRYYKKNLSLACAPDPGVAFAGSGLLHKLIYLAVALIMAAGSVMLLITAGDAEAPLGMDFSGLLAHPGSAGPAGRRRLSRPRRGRERVGSSRRLAQAAASAWPLPCP